MKTYHQKFVSFILLNFIISGCGNSGRGLKTDPQTQSPPATPATTPTVKLIAQKNGKSAQTDLLQNEIVLPENSNIYIQPTGESEVKFLFGGKNKSESFIRNGISFLFAPDSIDLQESPSVNDWVNPNSKRLAEYKLDDSLKSDFEFRFSTATLGKVELVQNELIDQVQTDGTVTHQSKSRFSALPYDLKAKLNESNDGVIFYLTGNQDALANLTYQMEPNTPSPAGYDHILCKKIRITQAPREGINILPGYFPANPKEVN